MQRSPRFLPLLLTLLVASCATPPKPASAPPPPRPAPAPAPVTADWRDLAETQGAWRYRVENGSRTALFEAAGAPLFTIRCEMATRRILLIRSDAPGATLKITTSYGSRTLTTPDLVASDSLLDQIAFSRGRFTVEAPGRPELVLPAWAEPARVIEDCRS